MNQMMESLNAKSSPGVNWNSFKSSLLIEVFRGNDIFTSSSVLITRNVILTAAHSVFGIDKGYVHIGREYSQSNIRIGFKKVVIHSDYNKKNSNFKNDIALIVLDRNLPLSIKPAIIAPMDSNFFENVERVGFGQREGGNKRTWTNPSILSQKESYFELSDSKSVVGDSGGPLYYKDNLIGLHSTIEGQKSFAVNVHHYKKWINDNLPLKSI